MLDWFVWKGERCTMHGIHALVLPDIITPEERVQFVNIPGRTGSVKVVENTNRPTYNELQFSVTCVVDDLSNIDNVIDYLEGTSRVEFANKEGGYYNATIVGQIDYAKVLRDNPHRSFGVSFRCYDPFWYFNDEEILDYQLSKTNGTVSKTIFNPGNAYAEPIIDIYPKKADADNVSGSGSIKINGTTITLKDIPLAENDKSNTSFLRLDIPKEECYWIKVDDNSVLSDGNHNVVCDIFPFFNPGDNKIVINHSSLGDVKIRPNWRRKK